MFDVGNGGGLWRRPKLYSSGEKRRGQRRDGMRRSEEPQPGMARSVVPAGHILPRAECSMREYASDLPAGIRYAAPAGTVTEHDDRRVEGTAYRSRGGYLFKDSSGDDWWIIFRRSTDGVSLRALVRGDVLACSASHEGKVQVRVLATGVLQHDADTGFREGTPSSFEEAAGLAASIPVRQG